LKRPLIMMNSLKPKKSLGQNFLINEKYLDELVEAAQIEKEDVVIEVGPGTGNLTKKLCEKAKLVIAIEKDDNLSKSLNQNIGNPNNLEIINKDILEFHPESRQESYKVVGNIPYYLTSHLIRTVLEQWPKPKTIVFTIQKQVAQRILAKPPKTNLLAIFTQYFCEPKIITYISKGNFWPKPRVDSAIIRLTPRDEQRNDTKQLFKFIKAGFSKPRKILISNLVTQLDIDKEQLIKTFQSIGLNPKSRAENLTIEDWQKISRS